MSHLENPHHRQRAGGARGRAFGAVAVAAGVLAAGLAFTPLAHAGTAAPAGNTHATGGTASGSSGSGSSGTGSTARGWTGIVRKPVSIPLGNGWTSKGELTYPSGTRGRLPLVVLLHGSGHNDMDETLPEGEGSVFVPVAQAANRQGFAVLRFNKRGVLDVGPVLTDDRTQLAPPKPYERILADAAAVVRFGAQLPAVDPSRIFLVGHSEGTQVASNLAANPAAAGIPKPAGVVTMGVVGSDIRSLLTYQLFGVHLAQLHEEFDVDGDGQLTYRESVDGLIGQPAEVVDVYRPVLLDGAKINRLIDRDRDGKLAIDSEVAAVFRKQSRIDDYPDAKDIDADVRAYVIDFDRFNNVAEDLPRFDGPTLLLNGENDIQTPARSARVADAAIAAAGRRDHTLITYPGVGHAMNVTSKFTGGYGEPDRLVLDDLARWLADHR